MIEQRRPLVPLHPLGSLDHVLALDGRDRDEGHVRRLEARAELAELVLDPLERRLLIADQVHLVHAHDEMSDPEQRGDERVTPRLLYDALSRVDQDHRQIRGRGAGDHVARIALVAGGVGDDELAAGGLEVAVGDVDRDALLALGP